MSPHPKQLESGEKLADSMGINLRSIRAEDDALLQDFAAHMSPEDLRLRFFSAMRGLSHELAARLSHIDKTRVRPRRQGRRARYPLRQRDRAKITAVTITEPFHVLSLAPGELEYTRSNTRSMRGSGREGA
jgi:hypothetical protein